MPHTKINEFIDRPGRYRVTGPVVVAELMDGQQSYLYKGAILPAQTRPSQIEYLLEQGMIKKLETR
ncbi:MAG: hypothetical protein CVT61_00230 [Actinobacteria bacterium HGW-Actinobacteria-11]|nr:MAG: hypothetical protein CVT61_00230 [Actinobacteria bacterium HGW-Actinobacteria-11]